MLSKAFTGCVGDGISQHFVEDIAWKDHEVSPHKIRVLINDLIICISLVGQDGSYFMVD
jgi:hypothetical protein